VFTGLVGPAELRGGKSLLIQSLTAVGLCVLLTDVLFVNVTSLPFTGEGRASTNNLAVILLQYFGLFPPLILITLSLEPWLARSAWHIALAVAVIAAVHFALRNTQRKHAEYNANLIDLDEDEEEFPQRLGLRY
jgi:cbb3-type cytochrome oxidase subunit 3